jgi:hypothetical protein
MVKLVFGQPNYHAGGAEIAGNWPPGGWRTSAAP